MKELIQYIKSEISRNIDIADQYVTDECSSLRGYDYCASMAVVDALQEVLKRLESEVDQPAPVQSRPTYNVLVLLDKHGRVEVGTDGLINVFILDETIKRHPEAHTKQEVGFFNTIWDRLPTHYTWGENPSIYDFSAVGL